MVYFNIKKLINGRLRTVTRLLLIGIVMSLLSLTFITNTVKDTFLSLSDMEYDYVLGTSSSQSQTVLNSLYCVGYPKTELSAEYYNILSDVKSVKTIIPIKQKDMYNGLQVIGTTKAFFDGIELSEGRLYSDNSREVVIGSKVADSQNLFIGSKVQIKHKTFKNGGIVGDKVAGPDDGKAYYHDDEFTVVGILSESGKIYDNLLYMDIEKSHSLHRKGVSSTGENTDTISALLINSGGEEGLSELNKLLVNDKSVNLYKVSDSKDVANQLRLDIDKMYPVFVVIMFILISVVIGLLLIVGINSIKEDIKAMLIVKVPKVDILTYVILDSVITLLIGSLLSCPLLSSIVKMLNGVLSNWSLILSTSRVAIVMVVAIPIISLFISIISYIVVDEVYKNYY